MNKNRNSRIIGRFVAKCKSLDMNLEQMGAAIGRTKGWASQIVNGQITRPHWRTRNRIEKFLEKGETL